ncbi:chain-length determining protein [Bacteroides ovatus]|uniref:Chain-length determining protein n=1 Tax=Bacteroides ovatus TaxID=28116 RepID=A0AAW6II88_BACOV|nr:chain-length determining protein [Bacteroides ovatus]MDC7960475.1 chain-length determining protein [Bacteroides ovatus]
MDENQSNSIENPNSAEMEIDLMGILHKIIAIRKVIYKAAGIGLVIGVIVTISIPKQYTVEVTLSPEMGTAKSSGLSGLAASFLGSGMTMGDDIDALNTSLSADIVSSTPFLLELKELKVNEGNTTLDTYLDSQSSPWWSYVIGAPGIMIEGVKSIFNDEEEVSAVGREKRGTIELTQKEAAKINHLKKSITASIDKKTSMTTVSVTFQNPKVAATVADSVIRKLQEYIINYRTSKAKEDCIYWEKLFKERQQEYYAAQKKYASYIDSHDNVILQSVRTEQERLQNDMGLAYQVYSQVATQLQMARAKVQEEKPVFAVVEPAVVPLKPSGKGLLIYTTIFIFLSVVGTIGWQLFGKEFSHRFKIEM